DLYFLDGLGEQAVVRVSKHGGPGQPVAKLGKPPHGWNQRATPLAVDERFVYVALGPSDYDAARARDRAAPPRLLIQRAPKDGSTPPEPLAKLERDPMQSLAVDASSLYFMGDSALFKMPKGGGAAERVALDHPVHGFVMDADALYVKTAHTSVSIIL